MFPDGGGTCTWRARRCKAKQGRHGKTALTYESYLYSSTDFAPRTRGVKDLFGNTHLRSYFVCHASPSVTHLSFAELFRLSRISVTHLMSRISRLSRISSRISQLCREISLGKLAKPEGPAHVVAWLLSDEAAYITGSHVICDGILMMRG